MTTVQELKLNGICVHESEGAEKCPHTYEQWNRMKGLGIVQLVDVENIQDGQSLYLFEYNKGFLSAGGGVARVDDKTQKIITSSQFWIS